MSLKGRSLIALLLFCMILLAHYYPMAAIAGYNHKIVYSTQDFSVIRGLLQKEPYVVLSVFDRGEQTIKNYTEIGKEDERFKLSFYAVPAFVF